MDRGERIFVALALAIVVAGLAGLLLPLPQRATAPAAATPTPFATPVAATASPQAPTAAPSEPSALADALAVHNELRAAIGAPRAASDPRLDAAALRHAEYLALNDAGGHDETEGLPGFTGRTVADRLRAQGFDATYASEVATQAGDAAGGVRSLWDLPYHRLGMMHPHLVAAGWGEAARDGRRVVVGVLVYDFATPAPPLTRSPAAGQRDVARSWHGRETPDPLPPGAARPVGWPIMAIAANAARLEVRAASLLRMSDGAAVPLHVAPQVFEPDYVALVPLVPLDPATTYRVRLELNIAGSALSDEWEFTTAR